MYEKINFSICCIVNLVYLHFRFKVVLRMIYHLQMVNPNYQHYQDRTLQIRSLMEFRYMINPYDIDGIQALGRHYMQNQMNLSGLLISLQKILVYKFNLYINQILTYFHKISLFFLCKLVFLQ